MLLELKAGTDQGRPNMNPIKTSLLLKLKILWSIFYWGCFNQKFLHKPQLNTEQISWVESIYIQLPTQYQR